MFCYSYSIMKECWKDDKASRPTFLELKGEFDGFISYDERYNYLTMDDAMAEGDRKSAPQPNECSDPAVLATQPAKCSVSGQEVVVTTAESQC